MNTRAKYGVSMRRDRDGKVFVITKWRRVSSGNPLDGRDRSGSCHLSWTEHVQRRNGRHL